MVTQTLSTINKNENNIKRATKIIYLLKVNGTTQTRIARQIGVSKQTFNKVMWGKAKSARINNWLKENLGV